MNNLREAISHLRLDEQHYQVDFEKTADWEAIDQEPFSFAHTLTGNPLLSINRLAELSEKVFDRPDYKRYYSAQEKSLSKQHLMSRLRNDILNIETNGRWLAMHYIDEMDQEYEKLFDEVLSALELASGVDIRNKMTWGSMSVFMNAPLLVVPYHFDHESNFLMQVKGQKFVRLYPRGTATLTEPEIEDFYRHNPVAGKFRPGMEDEGKLFVLTPGLGVHQPPLAPHLIRNGATASISVAVYYTLPETERRAHVYQVNYLMRKLGINPKSPGESIFWDRAKEKLMLALSISSPETHDEVLYSGIERLIAPFRYVKNLKVIKKQ